MEVLALEILLSEVIVHALALSFTHLVVENHLLVLVVLIGVDRGVAPLGWTVSSLVGVVPVVLSLWSWAEAVVLVLLPHVVVVENLLGEEASLVDINFLLDNLVTNGTVPHIGYPACEGLGLALVVLVLLVRVLDGGQVLLLLVQVVLIHLFLELDVLFVNSVDLLTEILVLSLQSLDQLVLLFDLLNLLVIEYLLDLDLVPQVDELLGFWHDLDEGLLLGVAGWLALLCFEGALAHLNGVW